MAYAKYTICMLFDPAKTWQHSYQIEKDLQDFLKTKGLEADKVEVVKGGEGESLLLVKRIDKILEPVLNPNQPKDSKKILDEMRNKPEKAQENKFKQGQFLPSKGYIKR